MISNMETKSSKKLSKELSDIFFNAVHEIDDLGEKAPNQIVESVHLIRKRLKFLRAFIKLIRFCTDRENCKPVNYILRDCGRIFSDCRDAHVRGLLLNEFIQDDSLTDVVQELITVNNNVTKELERNLLQDSALFDELISEINQKEVIDYIESLEANPECLIDGLTLGYEKSYQAFHSELKSHEADLLHEWRKRTKDLQYQLEVLLKSIPNQLSPSYDEIAILCEKLGRINDLFMFIGWLDSMQNSMESKKPSKKFREKLKKELKTLENEADSMGHSLLTMTPEEYSDELSLHLEI